MTDLRISVVIPVKDEAGAIGPLIEAIDRVLAAEAGREIVVVDDGSADGSPGIVAGLATRIPGLRLVRHQVSAGQSAAIHSGVLAARGGIVCTLDGDGQNPPEDLPKLIAPFRAPGSADLGLVAGQRARRQDSWSKRIASRLANAIRSFALQDGTRDTGCGLKAFRREAFLRLPYFDHMHRYLPALFRRDGWRVELTDVGHRPRAAGRSKYSNVQRAVVGAVDLLGVMWLIRRRKKTTPGTEET
jgi:dolichol-phosphate mannosyltransferase